MTVLDRCQNLQTQIERRNTLRRAHKDAEVFRERASSLKDLRESLQTAIAKVQVLRTRELVVGKSLDSSVATALIQEHQRKLSESPMDTGKDYARLKKSIDKIHKELVETADKAIESVKRDLPAIEETFLKQVEVIPAYKDQIIRIRMQRDALLNGIDPHSMQADALAQFLDSRDALRKLADQLNPQEFPKDVLDFFRATRQPGGAPLGKLTDPVRQWLAERDQLKNVRLTILGQ
jgi:hypothetical protein